MGCCCASTDDWSDGDHCIVTDGGSSDCYGVFSRPAPSPGKQSSPHRRLLLRILSECSESSRNSHNSHPILTYCTVARAGPTERPGIHTRFSAFSRERVQHAPLAVAISIDNSRQFKNCLLGQEAHGQAKPAFHAAVTIQSMFGTRQVVKRLTTAAPPPGETAEAGSDQVQGSKCLSINTQAPSMGSPQHQDASAVYAVAFGKCFYHMMF